MGERKSKTDTKQKLSTQNHPAYKTRKHIFQKLILRKLTKRTIRPSIHLNKVIFMNLTITLKIICLGCSKR